MNAFKIYKIDRNKITEDEFKQILEVEKSDGDGDSYSEEVIREIVIKDPKDDTFVCSHNGKIVGYISYNPKSQRRNGSAYIISLVVSPEYRRQGIAQKLICMACEYYCEKGGPTLMSLHVDKNNYPAINLYKKVGFEIGEPICELDEDDEQYIMAAEVSKVISKIEAITTRR